MLRTEFNAEMKQWNGQPIESEFCLNRSVGQVILNSLEVHGPRVAQICANTGMTTTFDELRAITINTVKNLRHFGCKKGDLIYFHTKNTADVAPVIFAALYLGVQVTAVPACFSRVEYESFLKLMKPKLLLCDIDTYQEIKLCLEYLNQDAMIFTFDDSIGESISVNTLFEHKVADSYLEPAVEINAFTHAAYILRTSGTTGRYKCVRISHAAILEKAKLLKCVFEPSDIVAGFTCLEGVSGVRFLFGSTFNGSTRIVNHGQFSPRRYFEIVAKFKATVSICNSKSVEYLLDHAEIGSANLSSLKYFCAGGSKIPYHVIQNMSKHLPRGKFCQTYGMTEAAGTIAMTLNHTRNDGVGQLVNGWKAKIVNEGGERLGIGEVGELCLKLTGPILGYFGDDKTTHNLLDGEGFFMTGDLARFDEDNDLFIVDRKKEMFKSLGLPVTPFQIEEFLNEIDGIQKSCVVPIPAENFDCLPASLIVKTSTSKCTEQSICNWALNNLLYYKHLRGGVYFVDELPVNASGKVDRSLVTKMAIELFEKSKLK